MSSGKSHFSLNENCSFLFLFHDRSIFFLLQNNACKTLLAILESKNDGENAERILCSLSPKQLVSNESALSVYIMGSLSKMHTVYIFHKSFSFYY